MNLFIKICIQRLFSLRRKFGRALIASSASFLAVPVALAAVPVPTVSTPPAGVNGFPFLTSSVNLAASGYTEKEFLISGNAQSFVNNGALGNNGVWNVSPGATAPYVTRMLVRTPSNAAKFNGTVVVEWLNVTGGIDASPEWDFAHVELLRSGYAWVGVTAQFVGASFLPLWDATRYASISHPGDSFSYDIFSQAGAAILRGNPQPLGSLTSRVRNLLASGESQSAFRMVTYYNAIQPQAKIYQGFLIHSTGFGAALSQSYAGGGLLGSATLPTPPGVPATPDIPVPPTAFIRSDLPQPVLFLNTETDIAVLGAGFSVHNQPDSNTFRMWELAGTSHADAYLLSYAGADAGRSGLPVPPMNCGNPPINNGPETFGVRAAVSALNNWVRFPLIKPSIGPRFSVQTITSPQPAAIIVRDPQTGNAVGGIALPQVAVPIETLSGIRPQAAVASNPNCVLFGGADPWDRDTDPWDNQQGLDLSPTPEPSLSALYGSKINYLFQYGAATAKSILQGFLLPADAAEVNQVAAQANVPAGSAGNADIIPNP
jgi:hypothetical protein